MMSVHWLKQTLHCEHRDLILTRSAYDHKRVRPLKPLVGGGQISGVLSPRTGGPPSYAKSSELNTKSPPATYSFSLKNNGISHSSITQGRREPFFLQVHATGQNLALFCTTPTSQSFLRGQSKLHLSLEFWQLTSLRCSAPIDPSRYDAYALQGCARANQQRQRHFGCS